jgi:hypothetical protein
MPLCPYTVRLFVRLVVYLGFLWHYATKRKVAGSRPDKVNDFFFSIILILLAGLGPGFYSTSNRNEYQKHTNNVSGE